MADTTTTTEWPAFLVATIRWATRLMPSASETEDPPYFCTMRDTGVVLLPVGRWAADGWSLPMVRDPAVTFSAAPRLLGYIEPGVRDHGMQRAQGRTTVRAPVVEVGVLPPPHGLGRASRIVVLDLVRAVCRYGRQVIGEPECRGLGVLVRVEQLEILL